MGSCSSSPSSIGSPDFEPTSIHLITMEHAMRVLLALLHRCFFVNTRNLPPPPPPVDRATEIGSRGFKPIYICLTTMKLAMRILLVSPIGDFLNFHRIRKIHLPSPRGLE